ncbi:hypothetical protein TNCV_4953391 [Trichonephila clavipes]|nr:hypothetical protein TNCV_4953391 [Trichonephila clavipes]
MRGTFLGVSCAKVYVGRGCRKARVLFSELKLPVAGRRDVCNFGFLWNRRDREKAFFPKFRDFSGREE